MTLQNSYMLYYICPMHTLFTIMVYAALGIGHRYNKTNLGIYCKYAAVLQNAGQQLPCLIIECFE